MARGPQFRPAQTPTDFSFIPKSIENIFDRFLQLQKGRKEDEKTAEARRIQARKETVASIGGDPTGFSAQELEQIPGQQGILTPTPQAEGIPQDIAAKLDPNLPQGEIGLGEFDQMADLKQRVQEAISRKRRGQEAGISAKERQGKPKPKTQQEIEDSEEFALNIEAITKATADGRLPKGEVPARGSITSAKIKVLGRVLRDNPGISLTDIRLRQASKLAETTVEARLDTKAKSEQAFQAFAKDVNFRVAGRSTLFGYAGRVNAQVDRALTVLSAKIVTNQRLNAGVADFSAVMAAGRPNQIELEENGYDSIRIRWTKAQQKITGKPTDIASPEIVAELKSLLREVKAIDNDIILGHLELMKIKHELVIGKFPDRSKRAIENLLKAIEDPDEEQVAGAQFSPEQARAELEKRRAAQVPGL